VIGRFISWLERHSLNHAGIVLLAMYPTILLFQMVGSNEWGAAIMWIAAYYAREVSMAQKFGRDVRAFWPGNWPTNHDRLQTLYLAIVAILFSLFYNML